MNKPKLIQTYLLLMLVAGSATSILSLSASASTGTQPSLSNGLVLRGRIVTMNETFGVINDGQIYIKGEEIVAISAYSNYRFPLVDTKDAVKIDTRGTIYPGLINNHDHIGFNLLPIFQVSGLYGERYEWQVEPQYLSDVYNPIQYVTANTDYLYFRSQANKWAEMKHLSAGTTSVQGANWYVSNNYNNMLLRNVDLENFGVDKVETCVANIAESFDAAGLIERMDSDQTDAWFVHLCEGTTAEMENEFQILKAKGLNRDETVIIHGTAMTPIDWGEAGTAEVSLVWSPTCELLLYGQTTDVVSAAEAEVDIALGTDWSPTGCKNLLDELKLAWNWNKEMLGGYFSGQDLVEMVTVNPAAQACWEDKVGRLKPGMFADVSVFEGNTGDPYESLISSTQRDVKLVLVGGDPLFGEPTLMQLLKPDDYETLYSPSGFCKAIDATKDGVNLGGQTYSQIENDLSEGLSLDYAFYHDHVRSLELQAMTEAELEAHMAEEYPGLHPIALDPLFSCDDSYYLDKLEESSNANLPFSIEALYYSWRCMETSGSPEDIEILNPHCGPSRHKVDFSCACSTTGSPVEEAKLFIDGVPYALASRASSLGTEYYTSLKLQKGWHSYRFEFCTSNAVDCTWPVTMMVG